MPADVTSQILTAVFTIIGGVVVLVLGELAKKFFIEPLHEQAKLLGEIAASVTIYGNVDAHTDNELAEKAALSFRTHAGRLRASTKAIHPYWLWSLLGIIPKRKKALAAADSLIGLANTTKSGSSSRLIHQKHLNANLGFKWE